MYRNKLERIMEYLVYLLVVSFLFAGCSGDDVAPVVAAADVLEIQKDTSLWLVWEGATGQTGAKVFGDGLRHYVFTREMNSGVGMVLLDANKQEPLTWFKTIGGGKGQWLRAADFQGFKTYIETLGYKEIDPKTLPSNVTQGFSTASPATLTCYEMVKWLTHLMSSEWTFIVSFYGTMQPGTWYEFMPDDLKPAVGVDG
jgi:hypothetical protein